MLASRGAAFSVAESQIVHGIRPTPIAAKTTITQCRSVVGRSVIAAYTVADDHYRIRSGPRGRRPGARTPGLVVMKFGGTSVGDTDKLKRVAERLVAAREAGAKVVAVLSAMGKTTDELIRLAYEVSPSPHPREYDMLVSTGERISNALCAMAIHDLGHEAVSLTGSQAGIVTDGSHTKAKIVEVRATPHPRGARAGQDRARRRLPGRLDATRTT